MLTAFTLNFLLVYTDRVPCPIIFTFSAVGEPSQKSESWNSGEPTWVLRSLPDPPYRGISPELSGIRVGEWWWEGREVGSELTDGSLQHCHPARKVQKPRAPAPDKADSGRQRSTVTVSPRHHTDSP